jgi:hypothetical protein
MRKRYANNRYVYDVNILTEKTNTGTMFFDVCWYKKRLVRPDSAHQNTYAYGKAASQEVSLDSVICPVTLTYSEQYGFYTLPHDQLEIVDSCMGGDALW